MRMLIVATFVLLHAAGVTKARAEEPFPPPGSRVVFLGDSITYAGHYVAQLDAYYRQHHPERKLELINVGLPSETASGLSEPDHPFPRPCVHERLRRVLKKARPDVVVACYGMNDGIYYPPSEERLAAFREGVRRLVDQSRASGATVVLLTPTAFDAAPLRDRDKLRPAGQDKYAWFAPFEDYDQVLAQYARWIMDQQPANRVVDVRSPVLREMRQQRVKNPKFSLASDGIHLNTAGHRLMSDAILRAWGETPQPVDKQFEQQAMLRMQLMRDAWLSHIGHKRPGIKPGLPLAEAQSKADEL